MLIFSFKHTDIRIIFIIRSRNEASVMAGHLFGDGPSWSRWCSCAPLVTCTRINATSRFGRTMDHFAGSAIVRSSNCSCEMNYHQEISLCADLQFPILTIHISFDLSMRTIEVPTDSPYSKRTRLLISSNTTLTTTVYPICDLSNWEMRKNKTLKRALRKPACCAIIF